MIQVRGSGLVCVEVSRLTLLSNLTWTLPVKNSIQTLTTSQLDKIPVPARRSVASASPVLEAGLSFGTPQLPVPHVPWLWKTEYLSQYGSMRPSVS